MLWVLLNLSATYGDLRVCKVSFVMICESCFVTSMYVCVMSVAVCVMSVVLHRCFFFDIGMVLLFW